MSKIVHATDAAPAAIGPYSQAIEAGGWLWISGQIPIDPATGQIDGDDIETQTRRCLSNLSAILAAAGVGPEALVRCTIYMKDLADYAQVNAIYAEFVGPVPPSRAAVEVSRLPKDVRVEIDGVAWLGDRSAP